MGPHLEATGHKDVVLCQLWLLSQAFVSAS